MRIEYNVIWFENDEGWLKPTLKAIQSFLEAYGFKLNAEIYADGSKINDILTAVHAKTKDVDIILMDYVLSGGSNGEKLIKIIRDSQLFTEIVFYSQNEGVKQIIEKEHGSIEGIYYAGRDNFRQKVQEVIWHTIKKVEDIESMRGLIMGAVSEIENIMLEIILSYIDTCGDEIRTKIATPIFESVGKSVKEKSGKYEEYQPQLKLNKLAKDHVLFDADKKAIAVQHIINEIKHADINHLLDDKFYTAFKNALTIRNKFGHAKVAISETGVRVLQSPPPVEEFTDERCIEIRKILIQHLDDINKLKSAVIKN